MTVWDWPGIELATPGSAVRHASVVRHVTDQATQPGIIKKVIFKNQCVDYDMDIKHQSACLVINPITVKSYSFLFNCTMVGQGSNSLTILTKTFIDWLVPSACLTEPIVAQLVV